MDESNIILVGPLPMDMTFIDLYNEFHNKGVGGILGAEIIVDSITGIKMGELSFDSKVNAQQAVDKFTQQELSGNMIVAKFKTAHEDSTSSHDIRALIGNSIGAAPKISAATACDGLRDYLVALEQKRKTHESEIKALEATVAELRRKVDATQFTPADRIALNKLSTDVQTCQANFESHKAITDAQQLDILLIKKIALKK